MSAPRSGQVSVVSQLLRADNSGSRSSSWASDLRQWRNCRSSGPHACLTIYTLNRYHAGSLPLILICANTAMNS